MPKGIKRQIDAASKKVRQEISYNSRGGFVAGALASEGYAGGYLQALSDVQLLLNGVRPNTRDYWDDIVIKTN